MRDQFLASQMPQRVLQLHELNKEVMLGIKPRHGHRRFEVKTQPLLNADSAQLRSSLGQIEEQQQIEHNWRGKDRIPAEEIYFDLHGIAEPSEDVYVVPAFFVVTARRIVVNADLVRELAVELRVKVRLQNVLEHRQLGFFLGLE